jgi:hypothetical protein
MMRPKELYMEYAASSGSPRLCGGIAESHELLEYSTSSILVGSPWPWFLIGRKTEKWSGSVTVMPMTATITNDVKINKLWYTSVYTTVVNPDAIVYRIATIIRNNAAQNSGGRPSQDGILINSVKNFPRIIDDHEQKIVRIL